MDIAKKDTKNAVVEERLQMASGSTSKIMSELRDESNSFSLFSPSFPLVGCDRKAPPAKVGLTMNRERISIAAFANGDSDIGYQIKSISNISRGGCLVLNQDLSTSDDVA